jgi:hypothetical protein
VHVAGLLRGLMGKILVCGKLHDKLNTGLSHMFVMRRIYFRVEM